MPTDNAQRLAGAIRGVLFDRIASSPIPTSTLIQKQLPTFDLADLAICRVPIAPATRRSSSASRTSKKLIRSIIVAPHLKANFIDGEFDESQTQTFIDFAEWIDDTLALPALQRLDAFTWESSTIEPMIDESLAHEKQVLKTIITINYHQLS
jgi:hypothetical protein